eukprot:3875589-Lingulodinium_polyedra.AAC.1
MCERIISSLVSNLFLPDSRLKTFAVPRWRTALPIGVSSRCLNAVSPFVWHGEAQGAAPPPLLLAELVEPRPARDH